jgi:hypothetical protein
MLRGRRFWSQEHGWAQKIRRKFIVLSGISCPGPISCSKQEDKIILPTIIVNLCTPCLIACGKDRSHTKISRGVFAVAYDPSSASHLSSKTVLSVFEFLHRLCKDWLLSNDNFPNFLIVPGLLLPCSIVQCPFASLNYTYKFFKNRFNFYDHYITIFTF